MNRAIHTVLVAGATGRTGQQIVKHLLKDGYHVRALVRDPVTAKEQLGPDVEYVQGDVREPATVVAALRGASAVISSLAARGKEGPNRPEVIDFEGVRNLVNAGKAARVRQFVLVSSRGVTQADHALNRVFGNVLVWKLRGEDELRASGLAYTIIRPASLLNEPGSTGGLAFEQGDRKVGSALSIPREDVASVCVQALKYPEATFRTFDVHRTDGAAPTDWKERFASLKPDAKQ